MKVLIKSKQIFETHVEDSVSETHECEVNYFENGFEIIYGNSIIKLIDDVLTLKSESTCLEVVSGKSSFSKMKTPYGELDLEIKGERLSWSREPFLVEVRYLIKIGNTNEYINEIQISII